MKKVLLATVIVVLAAVKSYGFGIESYAFTEHRDYTQQGKNIYSGEVGGVGVDMTLLNVGSASLTLNGKLYTGRLDARTSSIWVRHDVYPAIITIIDDTKAGINGWSIGANVSYPLLAEKNSLSVVPMLGIGYERERIAKVEPAKISGLDWSNLWSSSPVGTTTDRLALRAGLGVGQQILKDCDIGAGVVIGFPLAGQSKSDLGEIKNRGYDAEVKAGATYKKWVFSIYYGYSKKNILAQNSDQYHVKRYGVSLGYLFF